MGKSIWEILGLGPPKDNVWDRISDPSLTGIAPTGIELGLGTSVPPARSARAPDLSEQHAIIQQRQYPFNILDIRPFNYFDFSTLKVIRPLQANLRDILNKVGVDFESGLNATFGLDQALHSNAPWATEVIQTPGNFLKIEFLPSKVNYMWSDLNTTNPLSTTVFTRANQDQSYNPSKFHNDANFTPTDPSQDNPSNTYWSFWGHHSQIFVQFDSPDAPLILAKDGDIFELPFNAVYITFAIQAPAFSVITGNGATVRNSRDHKVMASNPAFGPADELWTIPKRHCTPFCFGEGDQVSSSGLSIAAGATSTLTLFSQTVSGSPAATLSGLAIGWISNIELSASASTASDPLYLEMRVIVLRPDGTSKQLTRLTLINRTGSPPAAVIERNYSIPKRFTLKTGEKLQVLTKNIAGGGAGITVNWNIDGYVWGRINSQLSNSNAFPGYQLEAIQSNPFPLDNNPVPS